VKRRIAREVIRLYLPCAFIGLAIQNQKVDRRYHDRENPYLSDTALDGTAFVMTRSSGLSVLKNNSLGKETSCCVALPV
jgi:hypothetical protein